MVTEAISFKLRPGVLAAETATRANKHSSASFMICVFRCVIIHVFVQQDGEGGQHGAVPPRRKKESDNKQGTALMQVWATLNIGIWFVEGAVSLLKESSLKEVCVTFPSCVPAGEGKYIFSAETIVLDAVSMLK